MIGDKLKEKKLRVVLIITGAVAAGLLIFSNFFITDSPTLTAGLNIIAIFIPVSPIIADRYSKYRIRKEYEDIFPVFLRDFVQGIKGGMTLPQTFKTVSSNDYGRLTPLVKKMSAQLEWGVPIEKVLLNFSKETKSKVIGRIVSSVVESHKFGGNLADTFEALSNTAIEIDRLRQERALYLQSQMITGYIIFFVFLGVIFGLQKFLLPSLATNNLSDILQQGDQGIVVEEYRILFRNLILLQGFFAGLSVGKMAEGSMIAGIKHSLFMMAVGGIVFFLFG